MYVCVYTVEEQILKALNINSDMNNKTFLYQ
jgi:hypothetical protein